MTLFQTNSEAIRQKYHIMIQIIYHRNVTIYIGLKQNSIVFKKVKAA